MSALSHGPVGDGHGVQARAVADLAQRLASLHDAGKMTSEFPTAAGGSPPLGRARKVSVSLPEDLTAAVQERVGKGEFSHYVTEAVARQLELDLLAELTGLLDAEHGPVSEEFLAEAGATWPDAE